MIETEEMLKGRPSWEEYFLWIAKVAATRATCPRKHVGAVIVRDKNILGTGYNGSMPGKPHCEDVGCLMEDNHCVRTVHAEANAVAQAARNGVPVDGATCYTTASPCFPCLKLLASAGIRKIVFSEEYRMDDPKVRDNSVSYYWDGKIGILTIRE